MFFRKANPLLLFSVIIMLFTYNQSAEVYFTNSHFQFLHFLHLASTCFSLPTSNFLPLTSYFKLLPSLSRRSEVRSQKSEARSNISEVITKKLEVRSWKSKVRNEFLIHDSCFVPIVLNVYSSCF